MTSLGMVRPCEPLAAPPCRGLATSLGDRDLHSLGALLPQGQVSEEVEVARARVAIERACTPLQKYQVGL